jgi:hypothetical protein
MSHIGEQRQKSNPRPGGFEDRYRLYLDESGDHVYRHMADTPHRFLCLLGCWFRNPDYLTFHDALETLKVKHFQHHPDDPIVLHREEMINARGDFRILRDEHARAAFDTDLLGLITHARFTVVAVVIDKYALWQAYGDAALHPYHLGLGFLLQRYAGYLNHINRVGDVMAESRGGAEDRLLANGYTNIYDAGAWRMSPQVFQTALTTRQLKLKQKRANISGLQLADVLGHPVKQWTLRRYGLLVEQQAPFAEQLMTIVEPKLNCHLYVGRVDGYGVVLYPKNRKAS